MAAVASTSMASRMALPLPPSAGSAASSAEAPVVSRPASRARSSRADYTYIYFIGNSRDL